MSPEMTSHGWKCLQVTQKWLLQGCILQEVPVMSPEMTSHGWKCLEVTQK